MNVAVQASTTHTYDENFLFFAVPILDMQTMGLSEGGANVDLSNALNALELGGIVWSASVFGTSNPAESPVAPESCCETLFLQRTFTDGSPLAFPSPWASTPPFGNSGATSPTEAEQTFLPIRTLSRREILVPDVGIISTTTSTIPGIAAIAGRFPTKSLRIRRRISDFTSLVLQYSFTAVDSGIEFDLRFSGTVYYRARF